MNGIINLHRVAELSEEGHDLGEGEGERERVKACWPQCLALRPLTPPPRKVHKQSSGANNIWSVAVVWAGQDSESSLEVLHVSSHTSYSGSLLI